VDRQIYPKPQLIQGGFPHPQFRRLSDHRKELNQQGDTVEAKLGYIFSRLDHSNHHKKIADDTSPGLPDDIFGMVPKKGSTRIPMDIEYAPDHKQSMPSGVTAVQVPNFGIHEIRHKESVYFFSDPLQQQKLEQLKRRSQDPTFSLY
jgi:hypothetical protein